MPKITNRIDKFIFAAVLILFYLVSLVPFFALKNIKLGPLPLHYLIIGGGVGFLVILTLIIQRKVTNFDKWLLFLMLGLAASIVTSVDRLATLNSLTSFFLRGVGVAFIVSKIINTDERRKLAVKFLLSGATLVCIIGLIEFFTGKTPFFHQLYLRQINGYPIAFSGRSGMLATIGHPLPLAAFLVLLFPLAIHFLKNSKYFFEFIPPFLIASTIFLSFSRSSWIGAFFAGIIYFSNKENLGILLKRWKIILFLLFSFIALFFIYPRTRNIFFGRVNLKTLKTEIGASHRFAAYKTTGRIFRHYPFFGVGFGNFPKVFEQYRTAGMDRSIPTPDNMYLRILGDTGLVGITTFFIFIFFYLFNLWRNRGKPMTLAIFAGVVGFLINQMAADLFLWLAPQFLFWFLVGLVPNWDYTPLALLRKAKQGG